MKILSMAWAIYDNRLKAFSNDYSGGGLVIRNLCEYIGRKAESYLFVGKFFLEEQKIGNINVVGTNYKMNEQDSDIVKDEHYIKNMARKFEMAVKRIEPDIVNFHGLGDLMLECVEVCDKIGVPYVYTEHLHIEFESDIERYDVVVKWEKQLYNMQKCPIIAVSNGIKKKILKDYPDMSEDNIRVIVNGTDFIAQYIENQYIEKYHLQNKKILLCVGSIVKRKNQIQIVDTYLQLPLEIRNNLKVIFCGKDSMKGELQTKITQQGLENDLIYIGAVNGEEMKKLYSIADGLIMPSLAEGLSIAALEAIAYGLPVIMFSDLEGADELNDHEVVCFSEHRSNESLVHAVEEWYWKDWDENYIIQYSKAFTMERMADNYLKYYEQVIENLKPF